MLIMSPVYLKGNEYKLIKNCAKIDISRIVTQGYEFRVIRVSRVLNPVLRESEK